MRTALLALVCFGPSLGFFAWVGWELGISRGNYTVLLIPVTAAVGATIIWLIARRLPSRAEVEARRRSGP